MRRQRNMAQMKEQNKTLGKELNKMEMSNLLDEIKKTGYQDVQETHLVLQQHKKDPGRNKGYTRLNKEKFTWNQQWRE